MPLLDALCDLRWLQGPDTGLLLLLLLLWLLRLLHVVSRVLLDSCSLRQLHPKLLHMLLLLTAMPLLLLQWWRSAWQRHVLLLYIPPLRARLQLLLLLPLWLLLWLLLHVGLAALRHVVQDLLLHMQRVSKKAMLHLL